MREERVDLPDVSLSVTVRGPDHGPLAILLHGFPDTPQTWRHLAPRLADAGWRVATPALRGYAPSSVPTTSCHVAALMADAVGVHAALGGRPDAVLVGHDWGAITANALAAHRDSPFARVVSMSVPPFLAMRGASVSALPRQVRNSWYVGFNQVPWLPELTFERLVRRLWKDWSPGYDAEEDVERVLAALPDRGHRRAALGYYRALTRPWQVPDRHRRWSGVEMKPPAVPMLYLHGGTDRALDVRLAGRVREHLPAGSEVAVVEGAGHFLQLERPDEVGRKVLGFLA